MADAPQPAAEATVPLKSPIAGVVEQVPVEEVQARAREGWTAPSVEEAREAELREKYGGAEYAALAAGTAFAKEATFGASDWALGQMAPDAAKSLGEIREYHDIPSTLGGLGGMAVGFGKVQGLGAAGKFLRAAGGPGRAVLKGGEAVERLGGGGIIGKGLRGAGEAAIWGAGEAISEDALGQKELTKESFAMDVGFNALLGGGLGSALGAAGKAAGWSGKKLQAAMRSEDAAAGLLETMFGYAGRGVAKAAALTGREGTEVLPQAFSSAAKRESMTHGKQLIAKEVPDFFKRFFGFTERSNLAGNKFKGTAKESEIAHVLDEALFPKQVDSARTVAGRFRTELNEMLLDKHLYSPTKIKGTKGLEASVEHIEGVLARLDEITKPNPLGIVTPVGVPRKYSRELMAQLNTAVDSLKRDEGKFTKFYRGKSHKLGNEQRTFDKLKGLYGYARKELENTASWGDAGTLYKVVNGTWTPAIQGDDLTGFARHWLKPHQPTGAFKEDVWLPTLDQVDTVFSNVVNPKGDAAIQAMRGHLETHVAHNEMIAKSLKNLSPEQRKWLLESRSEAKALLEQLDTVAEHATSVNQMQLLEGGSDSAGMIGGFIGGGLASGNPALAAAGVLMGPVLNPARTVRQLALMDRTLRKTQEVLAGAGGPLRAAAKAARPIAVRTALQLRENKRSERAAHAVTQAKGTDIAALVRSNLSYMAQGAPDTVEGAADHVQRGLNYLAEHAPQPHSRYGALGAIEIPPSEAELQRFERRRRAVEDPRTIIRDLADGMVSYEAVDAVRKTAPAFYEALQKQIVHDLQGLGEKGLMIPYLDSRSASMILGHPIDPLDTPEVAQIIQRIYHEPDPKPLPGRRPAKGGDRELGDNISLTADRELEEA
uniref:Uncharacterized protein n=1 Tax=viral metagenome TaxID=1070528 RepID=A0A6H1ZBX9_9ZZZZ